MCSPRDSLFGDITREQFLQEYWQKKPLLIRQAFSDFESPVDKEDLFELASLPEVESRLVQENTASGPWQLTNGPFESDFFSQLPDHAWTLLVQGLDHWSEEAADLLDTFRFVPNWRVDDVMASFAVDGGSVGPHYDHYDVFLLQAKGVREWKVGQVCSPDSPRVSGTPLRILANFDTQAVWELAPGDMLYLPPCVAHHGVAQGECITLSIGYRTPSLAELADEIALSLSSSATEIHMPDASHTGDGNVGEITPDTIKRLKGFLSEHLLNDNNLFRIFSEYATRPKTESIIAPPDTPLCKEDLIQMMGDCSRVCWTEGSRQVWHRSSGEIVLYADGESFRLPEKWLDTICLWTSRRTQELATLSPFLLSDEGMELTLKLYNQGSIYFD